MSKATQVFACKSNTSFEIDDEVDLIEPRCETCRYSLRRGNLQHPNNSYYCRKNPPTANKNYLAEWPIVLDIDWCGEYQPKEVT